MKRELSSYDKNSELGKNTAFQPVMENENVLLPSKSTLTCNLQRSSGRGHSVGKCSLKQESLDNSSFDLPLPRESTSCGSQRKMDDAPRFDLNIAASALDEPLRGSLMEQAGNESLGLECLLFKKSGSVCPPMLQKKSDESLRLSNLSQSTDQHSDSGISLDLQLKQPRRPGPQFSWTDGPGIQDSGADLSLSLAGKLSRDSSSLQPVPIKETIQKNNSVVEFGLPKLRRPTHVKSEQCEVTLQDAASIGAGSMSRGPKASSLHVSSTKLTATSCCAKKVGDTVGGKILSSESKFDIDLNYKPVDSGDNMHHVPRCITASAPSEASKITEKGPSQAASHSPIPDSNESLYYDEVPKNSCFSGDARGNSEKASVFVSKSLEFEGNKFIAAKDTRTEMDTSLLRHSVALKNNETAIMDYNETTSDGAGIGDLTGAVASDGEDLKSPKIAADIAHMEPGSTGNVTGNNDQVEVPSVVDEEPCDFDYESTVSQHVGETLLEQFDDDDNYEDEDVEVTVTNEEGKTSVERTEERMLQGDEGVDSTNVNKHPMKPLCEDGNDEHCENHVDFVDKRELGITKPEILLPPSGKRPVNFACRANEESIARPTNGGGHDNVSRHERTARGKVFDANGCASNQGNWRSKQNRPIMQYTGPNRSSYKQMKHNNTIPVTSYAKGRRFSKNVHRRGMPHSWWHSERSHDDRFHRPGDENSLQQYGRQRSDSTWDRGHPVRIKNSQEDDFTVTSDYSVRTGGRPVKKWFRDERSDVPDGPDPPPQSQAHNGDDGRISGGFQNSSRPMKNIGPRSRYIERDVPHFRVKNDYKEKFLSELQDETTDRSFSYAHKHYDQVENAQRNSHSPLHCGPMHASPSCLNSSQRPSDQSLQHGKSPEICNGRPELIHRKPIRSRREPNFQPSLQNPRFPHGDGIVRREEPIYDDEGGDRPITKPPSRIVSSSRREDGQNICSNPEQILGLQPLQHDEYSDYVAGAEFDKDRLDERHVITRPLRQQLYGDRQGRPFVAENSHHLRPNRYNFKKERNGIVHNGAPVKRRY